MEGTLAAAAGPEAAWEAAGTTGAQLLHSFCTAPKLAWVKVRTRGVVGAAATFPGNENENRRAEQRRKEKPGLVWGAQAPY
eukprot:scaffold111580_cov75-Phaeocystis_antarctica.AAC.4